jgi:hypothetical protein
MIFTIIGGLVAGVSGILVARYSEKRGGRPSTFETLSNIA